MGFKLASGSACDICLDSFSDDKPPLTTLCGHIFCSECLRHLREPTCPTCRKPIRDERGVQIVRMVVDFEDPKALELQERINTIGLQGIDRQGLKDFVHDCKEFLRPHKPPAYNNLRAALKLIWLAATMSQSNSDMQEKLEEEFRLKLEAERNVHESALNLHKAEKNLMQRQMEEAERRNMANLQSTVSAYNGLMQKHEALMIEWETLREELRRLEDADRSTTVPNYSDRPLALSENVTQILSKEKPDPRLLFNVPTSMISPVNLPIDSKLAQLVDPETAEKMLRLEILSPCGDSGHPYLCHCAPPPLSSKTLSESVSSDSSSSPAGPPTPPIYTHPSRLSGISLTAPKANKTGATIDPGPGPGSGSVRESEPPTKARVSHRKTTKKSSSNPILSTGKATAAPSVNTTTTISVGQEGEVEPENTQLLSRLSDLLTDPSTSPSSTYLAASLEPSSVGISPLPASAQFDSLRSNRSSASASSYTKTRPPLRAAFTADAIPNPSGHTKRTSPVAIGPPRSSTMPMVPSSNYNSSNSGATAAVPPIPSPSNWQTAALGSVPRAGISSASDAARRAMEKQHASSSSSAYGPAGPPLTSSASAAKYSNQHPTSSSSGPVSIPGGTSANRQRVH